MTDPETNPALEAALDRVQVRASGRTRHEGQEPRDDELMLAEIGRLRAEADRYDNPAWTANDRLNRRCEIAYRALERIVAEGGSEQCERIARQALDDCADAL